MPLQSPEPPRECAGPVWSFLYRTDIKRRGLQSCGKAVMTRFNTSFCSKLPWSLASTQISPGPFGADLPSSKKNKPSKWPKRRTLSKGIVTDGKSLHAPTLTKMSAEVVRQSRLSPARDLERPRPLGFTVTGQTLTTT